ncbi:MAG: NAD+ synthase [Halothiobacillaceae bacterium]|nr:MAG: NAD+ synthase [Halothiobacillaceae bacterium]
MRIALAQLNLTVGDIEGNAARVIDWTRQAVDRFQADLIVFPELTLSGYPPEDLVKRADFMAACDAAVQRLLRELPQGIGVVIGLPENIDGKRYNSAIVLRDGEIVARYHKHRLPNYGVFDELRYFSPGAEACVFEWSGRPGNAKDSPKGPSSVIASEAKPSNAPAGPCAPGSPRPSGPRYDEMHRPSSPDEALAESGTGAPGLHALALTLCEDIWHPAPIAQARAAGARLILNLNASPYQHDKPGLREQTLRARAAETGLPIVYVNLMGGQDELVFDGGSMVMDAKGEVVHRLPMFEEALGCVELAPLEGEAAFSPLSLEGRGVGGEGAGRQAEAPGFSIRPIDAIRAEPLDETAAIYRALVLAIRDYAHKNGFRGALLGLSGGIDSALTLALAVDALGADQVEAVMLPSRYTADISQTDAAAEAQALGVTYHVVPIEPAFTAFQQMLAPLLHGPTEGATDENLQARSRGVILMGLSNATGKLLLTTGNKSEMAVGYATLYGDMAGGFAPLKDVPKMRVYRLANYRNTLSPVIPERVITRPPSAELRPDQKDEDSLPPYPVLDAILEAYIERMEGIPEIVAKGFDEATVRRIVRMVDLAEYKRRQAPPGAKVTSRAFGRERRFPITNGFRR